MRAWAALGLGAVLSGLLGGCDLIDGGPRMAEAPVVVPLDAPASEGCPWVGSDRSRPAVAAPGMAPAPAVRLVTGCAIVRFTVAGDGSVNRAVLRAAYPLNAGPSALLALRQMRFAPGGRPDTAFVIRLSLRKDAAGRVTVTPDVPAQRIGFWDWV